MLHLLKKKKKLLGLFWCDQLGWRGLYIVMWLILTNTLFTDEGFTGWFDPRYTNKGFIVWCDQGDWRTLYSAMWLSLTNTLFEDEGFTGWFDPSFTNKGFIVWCDRCDWRTLYSAMWLSLTKASYTDVPVGSPSCGWNVIVYAFDISYLSLPTPFYYVLVSVSVFIALSTVFQSINSPDNSPFSHTLFFWSHLCLTGPFNYISLYESLLQPWYNP